jgi:hypothetical protein
MENKEKFALKLNGRQYGSEIGEEEEREAKDLGLLVIFGYSDDNVEFRGYFSDEVGCYDGGNIKIHKNGVLPRHEDCECEHCGYSILASLCASIEAIWPGEEGYSWTYKTNIPHSTFDILDDGEKYCRGLVIDIQSLPQICEKD